MATRPIDRPLPFEPASFSGDVEVELITGARLWADDDGLWFNTAPELQDLYIIDATPTFQVEDTNKIFRPELRFRSAQLRAESLSDVTPQPDINLHAAESAAMEPEADPLKTFKLGAVMLIIGLILGAVSIVTALGVLSHLSAALVALGCVIAAGAAERHRSGG